MYAYKLPQPDPQPTRRPRRVPRSHPRSRQSPYRAIATEAAIKLGVNVLLSVVAIAAIGQLLPHRASQEARLKELDVAVRTAGERFGRVQTSFRQYFDPHQARFLMQEQSNRIDPSQRQVIWQQTPTQTPTELDAVPVEPAKQN